MSDQQDFSIIRDIIRNISNTESRKDLLTNKRETAFKLHLNKDKLSVFNITEASENEPCKLHSSTYPLHDGEFEGSIYNVHTHPIKCSGFLRNDNILSLKLTAIPSSIDLCNLTLSLYEYFEDGKFCDIIEAVIGPSHYSVYRCGKWLREEITKLAKDKNKEGLGKLLQVIDNNTNYIMSKHLLGEQRLLRDSELKLIKKLFYNLVDDNDDVIDIEVYRY